MSNEHIVELNLGITPEAAVSGAVLIQTELSTFLTFNAIRPTDRPFPHGGFYTETAGIALLEFVGCSITKFGYPNDEAWNGIPRTRGLGYGMYEVENSQWKHDLVKLNKHSFPKTENWNGRHFLILFHDSSFECIATDLKLEVTKEPYPEVFQRITSRILSE
jgi:hypothetical protein